MAKVVPIGQPVNEVERDAIAFLRDHLPDNYTVFHNVEIADVGRAPLEYDIIVLGEHAIYSVEVKGYRGRVTGNKRDWYVAGRHRRSPLPTTFQKARVLSGRLRHAKKGIGPIWVEAMVFLANPLVEMSFGSEVSAHIHTHDTIVAALTDRDALHLPHWPIKPPGRYAGAIEQFLLGGRPPPTRSRIGSYRLLQEIGRTEYFRDYEAVNETLLATGEAEDEQIVRLRLYPVDPYAPEEKAEQQLRRGRWEASVLKMLGEHDGLLVAGDPFFPVDDDIGVALPFEYAEGVTLRSFLEAHGPLSPDQCIERFSAAIQALGLAHSRAVVHRRITPDAFLCAESGPFRLGDFAFSAIAELQEWEDEPPTDLHRDYSAPEVLRGEPATPAADVFSLGVVLLEAILGRRPFVTVEDAELPPKEVNECGALAALLRDMLQPEPASRPSNGYDVIERLVDDQGPKKLPIRLVTGDILLTAGAVVNDSYEIERRLGPPRTRTSYLAKHRVSDHRRMLRFFEADAGTLREAREAFARCYLLHHRCLARFNLLDRVRDPDLVGPNGDPIYFLDLEFIPGQTARSLIEGGGVPPRTAISICTQVGDLLTYLSGFDLHHGGIECANVYVAEGDQVIVARPPSLLPQKTLSPPFFSHFDPADEAGLEQDFRSLAVLCWELITGIHPFELHSDIERDLGAVDLATPDGELARKIGLLVRDTMKRKVEATEFVKRLSRL